MKVMEIEDVSIWNKFLKNQEFGQFLQSSQWLKLQELGGYKVFRLGVLDETGELKAVAGLILVSTPFKKNYFYCPRGPVIDKGVEDKRIYLEELLKKIEALAVSQGVIFLRCEPGFYFPPNWDRRVKDSSEIQPAQTLILDLSLPQEELLKHMHQKTRYNIRLSLKKGVRVRDGKEEDFESFWSLMEKTGKRDSFRTHSKEHYKRILDLDQQFTKLKVAEYQGQILAAGIFSFFGSVATYMHGASSYKHRRLMAPYALQWEVIKEAQERGHLYYDLYGINEKKWPGVTRFKTGFGGTTVKYPGTKDLVFRGKWYNVYKLLRRVRLWYSRFK